MVMVPKSNGDSMTVRSIPEYTIYGMEQLLHDVVVGRWQGFQNKPAAAGVPPAT